MMKDINTVSNDSDRANIVSDLDNAAANTINTQTDSDDMISMAEKLTYMTGKTIPCWSASEIMVSKRPD